jgi:hypothetical protein
MFWLTRLFIRLVALVVLPIIVTISMIYMIPRDETDLEALLGDEHCPKFCFLGIIPNVTSLEKALERLREHRWIAKVWIKPSHQQVSWQWSGQQPGLIDTKRAPFLEYNNGHVTQIHLQSNIPFGEVLLRWADLKRKQSVSIIGFLSSIPSITNFFYIGNGYVAAASLACGDFWDSPTSIILGATPRYISNLGRIRYDLRVIRHIANARCSCTC